MEERGKEFSAQEAESHPDGSESISDSSIVDTGVDPLFPAFLGDFCPEAIIYRFDFPFVCEDMDGVFSGIACLGDEGVQDFGFLALLRLAVFLCGDTGQFLSFLQSELHTVSDIV